jgi:hypothetical protein
MWGTSTRGLATALLCLWTGILSSACGGGGDNDEAAPPNDTVVPEEQAKTTRSAPVTLHIQMTGLLLLVRDAGERTHVAATRMLDHTNYIGFFKQNNTNCDRYNLQRNICYVLMDDWLVDSIGPMGSPGPAGPLPSSVFDLTQGSEGGTVDVNALRGRSKSMITLLGGSLADTCSLARWTFDPPGPTQPGTIEPVNRLGWQIPDIGADSVLIIRRKSAGPQRDTLVAHSNAQHVIELLILNIPPEDSVGLFAPPPTSTPQPTTPNPARMEAHVRAYYAHMGLANPASHPVPTLPIHKIRETCPITILGLQNDTGIVRAGEAASGIRTQSCIIAAATAG